MAAFNRVAALLLGLFFLVLGLLVPAEIVHSAVLARSGELLLPWQAITRWLTGHDWSTSPVRTLSIGVGVLGLLLLFAQLKRRRPGLLTLTTADEHLTSGTTRRSVARALAARAEDVDGISSAGVQLGRRQATVHATTGQRDPGDLQQQVTDQVTGWLDGLGLVSPPRVRVRVTTKED